MDQRFKGEVDMQYIERKSNNGRVFLVFTEGEFPKSLFAKDEIVSGIFIWHPSKGIFWKIFANRKDPEISKEVEKLENMFQNLLNRRS